MDLLLNTIDLLSNLFDSLRHIHENIRIVTVRKSTGITKIMNGNHESCRMSDMPIILTHTHKYVHTHAMHTCAHTYWIAILLISLISVALTSCSNGGTYAGIEIIKFSNVKLSSGIGNVANFKSSGTFTCEKQGLYLVGAYIMSYSTLAGFQIIKNGILVSRVQVSPTFTSTGNDNYHTGTGIIAVHLNSNDTINIKSSHTMKVYPGGYSCLTVIKVN